MMLMVVAVILSALLIRVSLVCQGFPGFHQGHIGILSHKDEDERMLSSMWKQMWRMMRRKMRMRMEEARGESFSELRSNHAAAAVESGPRAKDAELLAPK